MRTRARTWWDSPRVRVVRLLPREGPLLFVAALFGPVSSAGLSVAFTILSGLLVGAVPAAIKGGFGSPAGHRLTTYLLGLAGAYTASQVVPTVCSLCAEVLGRRLDRDLNQRLMAAVLAPPGVEHLEDPATLDEVMKASGSPRGLTPGMVVNALVNKWSSKLPGVGALLIVARFHWWLAVGLVAICAVQLRFWRRRYDEVTSAIFNRGDLHRRSAYFRDIVLTPPAAKEVRAFGLARWVDAQFHDEWSEAMAAVWPRIRGGKLGLAGSTGLWVMTTCASVALVGDAGASGRISLAAAMIYAQAAMSAVSLASVGDWDETVAEGSAAVPFLLALEARLLPLAPRTGAPMPGRFPERAITFDDVSFTYPGRDEPVFDHLRLTIAAGESLAIVGDNGAGKTTLIKLLAGLHQPTAGRILVDGRPLADFDPGDRHHWLAAIFQDFERYLLPVVDNVGFGAIGRIDDRAALERAAERAGASGVIAGLPCGWDTPLSRQLTSGADLSGGQWQKVALARALFAVEAGAQVLVLDEPTANLDVRAEAELYDRFLDLTAGLTTIVISHRFSTVRRASRIVVLRDRAVVEDGSHEELVALGGRYAHMFALQAQRFLVDE